MRVVLALGVLAACTDAADPCDGIDGLCVAMRVESQPVFDELELGITINAQQSIVTRSTIGTAAPFVVPLDIGGQAITVDIVAVGRSGQTVVAAGAVSIDASSERTDITLPLMVPLTCVDTGHYCGGDKLYGDPQILYTCNAGGVPELNEVCENACVVAAAGSDDYCRD